jgi:hypothetical protein
VTSAAAWVVGCWLLVGSGDPEAEWSKPPVATPPAATVPVGLTPPPLPPADDKPQELIRTEPLRNMPATFFVDGKAARTVFGADSLGKRSGAAGTYVGWPLQGVRGAFGITDWLDLGLSAETFFLQMIDARAFFRLRPYGGENFQVSLVADGGYAFFAVTADGEGLGPRWATGRRDWNTAGGVLVSWLNHSGKGNRITVDLRYQFSYDPHPVALNPLGSGNSRYGSAYQLRVWGELPFAARRTMLLYVGLDYHSRVEDSRVMPYVGVGATTW